MPRESYISGAAGKRTDSRRQKWVKILNHYQDQSGSLRKNDPQLGDSKRLLAAKVLAALQTVTLKD